MPPAQINNAYLNFIASHDGIGMRPAEGILDNIILDKLFKRVKKNGGKFSFRKVESKNKVYEANIALFDALKRTDFDKDGIFAVERYIAAHSILLALEGVPAIYFNSLFGTPNDQNAFIKTGIKRNINRFKWEFSDLSKKLKNKNSLENIIYSKLLKIFLDTFGKIIHLLNDLDVILALIIARGIWKDFTLIIRFGHISESTKKSALGFHNFKKCFIRKL